MSLQSTTGCWGTLSEEDVFRVSFITNTNTQTRVDQLIIICIMRTRHAVWYVPRAPLLCKRFFLTEDPLTEDSLDSADSRSLRSPRSTGRHDHNPQSSSSQTITVIKIITELEHLILTIVCCGNDANRSTGRRVVGSRLFTEIRGKETQENVRRNRKCKFNAHVMVYDRM